MSFGIKIRKADKLFREYLIKLREEVSAFSGKKGIVQVSHFWGRRRESVRYDPENADLLLFNEHQYFEENPNDYRNWKLKQLGEKRFKALEIRANTFCKRDDAMRELELLEALKLLEK